MSINVSACRYSSGIPVIFRLIHPCTTLSSSTTRSHVLADRLSIPETIVPVETELKRENGKEDTHTRCWRCEGTPKTAPTCRCWVLLEPPGGRYPSQNGPVRGEWAPDSGERAVPQLARAITGPPFRRCGPDRMSMGPHDVGRCVPRRRVYTWGRTRACIRAEGNPET